MFFILLPAPSPAQNGSVLVAAASSMKFAFDELILQFQKENPDISIKVSYGSSGNFFSQIANGAPYDIFFSADMEYPQRLKSEGHGHSDHDVFPYAMGHIVLWLPHNAGMDAEQAKMRSLFNPAVIWLPHDAGMDAEREKMRSLINLTTRKIAIANPRHAPYGRAAVEALKALKVFEQVQSRLVMGENVSQAAQFAHTRAAQASIIALSLALTSKMKSTGSFWEIPAEFYQPIDQGHLILKGSRNPSAADSLGRFIAGKRGQKILQRYGFSFPGGESP